MSTLHDTHTLMACAQGLTLVGMAGVYLVPRRLFVIVRDFLADRRRISLGAAWLMFIASLAPTLVAIVLGANVLPRSLRCLAGDGCGPSQAGGLLLLAPLGLAVIVMEGAGFAAWLIHRHLPRRPPA
jgi:hypothetical protein